jgi:ribokinase
MPHTHKHVLVIGSSNVDFIMQAPHLPARGETVTNCGFMQTFGGKGANQAVAAARSGGDTTFLAAVGDDVFGQQMRENFRRDGIRVDFLKSVPEVPSGSALVMFDQHGDNYLTVAPGANGHLVPEDIEQNHSLIENSGIILLQMEIPERTNREVLSFATRAGVPVMFNYAPVNDLEIPVSAAMNWLVVNEVEASALTGRDVTDPPSARVAAERLREKGPAHVVLTLGTRGLHYFGERGHLHLPAFTVPARDTTAAGDTFCGALATAIFEDQPVEDALRFASAAAALSVGRMGAQPSIPQRNEIEAFLRDQA